MRYIKGKYTGGRERGIYPMHSVTVMIRKQLAKEYKTILKK